MSFAETLPEYEQCLPIQLASFFRSPQLAFDVGQRFPSDRRARVGVSHRLLLYSKSLKQKSPGNWKASPGPFDEGEIVEHDRHLEISRTEPLPKYSKRPTIQAFGFGQFA
jgi:hypothetical protein